MNREQVVAKALHDDRCKCGEFPCMAVDGVERRFVAQEMTGQAVRDAQVAEAAIREYEDSDGLTEVCAKALYDLATWCAINLDGEDPDEFNAWSEITDEEVRDNYTIRASTVLRAARGATP